MAQNKKITEIDTIPFQGGQDTYHEPGLLPAGSYSLVKNMRQMHPGLKQRLGYIKAHATADSTNSVMSMYQFTKGKVSEVHTYAQMSDGDVLEATTNPPTSVELMTLDVSPATAWSEGDTITGVTSGKTCVIVCYVSATTYYVKDRSGTFTLGEVLTNGTYTADQGASNPTFSSAATFGSEVFSGTASPNPASWSTLDDLLIFSNGVDQHQICAGTTSPIQKFVVYNKDEWLEDIPSYGTDYTYQINSNADTSNAVLDSLGTTYSAIDASDDVTVSVTGTAVTGTGTGFLTQLTVGQPITIEGYATSTLTGTDVPHDNDQFVIGTKTYTWKTALTPTEGEVLIGGNLANALDNVKLAINRTDPTTNDGVKYKVAAQNPDVQATTNTDTTQKILARSSGTAGNSIATTVPGGGSGHYTWTSTVLAGGADSENHVVATITSDTACTIVTSISGTHTVSTVKTNRDCLLICSKIQPNRLTFTIPYPNGSTSTALVSYMTSTGWKNLTVTDGTSSSSKTLATTGASMTWTQPTDSIPYFMYGVNGFWVKIAFTAALDSKVEISKCTYGSAWTPIQDVWDGNLVDAIEAQTYIDASAASKRYLAQKIGQVQTLGSSGSSGGGGGTLYLPITQRNTNTTKPSPYTIYGSSAITVGGITASDKVYFSSPDPIVGFYVDVGATPNTTASTAINSVYYINTVGTGVSVGSFTDGTAGLSKSGYVTFLRQSGITPVQFNDTGYSAYWYYFTVDQTISADTEISIQVMPYYDISNYGLGLCNGVWKSKMVYVFDKDPAYIYIVDPSNIQSISSSSTLVWKVGDGRNNKIVNIKQFYNELMVFQEEKGSGGGCLTLIQGTKADDMGAIHISNYYGTMNSKSVSIVENEDGHRIYFLSKKGIMVSDGRGATYVKGFDKVRNYFDPSDTDCIRNGYESYMYLDYDSVFNVLKIGLTTGSGTNNNVFLVYDLILGEFMCDTYANNFTCEYECDATYGVSPVVRLGGGQSNGFIYVLNSGLNDVTTAISGEVDIELNNRGKVIRDCEMILRVKTQTGSMTLTPFRNGVTNSSLAKTLLLTAERTGDRIRRHRIPLNFVDQNTTVKLTHATASESWYLLDWGVNIQEYTEQ